MPFSHISRRRFLSTSLAAAGAAALGPNLLLRGQDAASKKLNIAVIGALGKGESDTKNVTLEHNIVGICDVDSKRAEQALQKWSKTFTEKGKEVPSQAPKTYQDFRKMLDELGKGVDAVIVSTPDHAHFAAAMWAVKNKKHVCVQKPMCNTIAEVRELHRAAKAAGVVTQMGNQGRTMEGQRQVKEWIEQGAIGTLKEIRLWTNRPIWPQGPVTKFPAQAPEGLDWNLWLAQEKEEPYFEFETAGEAGKRKSVHPFNWRGWWAYGAGALGDMGCHIMDATFSILGQRIPEKIEVESAKVTDLTAPLWTNLIYHFGKTDKFPALKVTWNDGRTADGQANKPERPEMIPEAIFNKASSGMIFIGTDGAIMDAEAYCGNPKIYPDARAAEMKDRQFQKTERRSTHPGNPQLEWANAIVTNGPTSSTFDYAAPLTEFVLLGNLATRAGQAVQWDAKEMKVTNVPEANQYVKRAANRPGWV